MMVNLCSRMYNTIQQIFHMSRSLVWTIHIYTPLSVCQGQIYAGFPELNVWYKYCTAMIVVLFIKSYYIESLFKDIPRHNRSSGCLILHILVWITWTVTCKFLLSFDVLIPFKGRVFFIKQVLLDRAHLYTYTLHCTRSTNYRWVWKYIGYCKKWTPSLRESNVTDSEGCIYYGLMIK